MGSVLHGSARTTPCRRVVVLHDVIEQTGFINWVRGLDGPWVFPRLHKVGADKAVGLPAATASKRMIRSMKEVGIHVPTVGVFHSVRHGLKDWLRDHKVSERTIDLQVGHAHESVSASYGSPYLRTEEIHLLATLPLPDGLDLSPYIEKGRASSRRP